MLFGFYDQCLAMKTDCNQQDIQDGLIINIHGCSNNMQRRTQQPQPLRMLGNHLTNYDFQVWPMILWQKIISPLKLLGTIQTQIRR
jgi:hypothetical protein